MRFLPERQRVADPLQHVRKLRFARRLPGFKELGAELRTQRGGTVRFAGRQIGGIRQA
jgi:hypothetical protein